MATVKPTANVVPSIFFDNLSVFEVNFSSFISFLFVLVQRILS